MSHSETSERILDAAASLFAERGFAATTTRELAARAGVNEVTVFRHFETKTGVLAALGERMGRDCAAYAIEEGPLPEDPVESLRELAKREVAGAERNGAMATRLALEAASVPEVRRVIEGGPQAGFEAVREHMRRLQERGEIRADVDPGVVAEAFASLTSSYVIYRQVLGLDLDDDRTIEETVDQLVDVFWAGVGARDTAG